MSFIAKVSFLLLCLQPGLGANALEKQGEGHLCTQTAFLQHAGDISTFQSKLINVVLDKVQFSVEKLISRMVNLSKTNKDVYLPLLDKQEASGMIQDTSPELFPLEYLLTESAYADANKTCQTSFSYSQLLETPSTATQMTKLQNFLEKSKIEKVPLQLILTPKGILSMDGQLFIKYRSGDTMATYKHGALVRKDLLIEAIDSAASTGKIICQ